MSFQKKGTHYRTRLIVCSLLLSILLAACGGSSTGNSSNSNSSNSNTSGVPNTAEQERKTRMQHYMVQQEQTFVLQEDMQPFMAEISTMRSLAEEAGVAGHLLEELDVFKHQVEHLDASAWERKEVRFLNRNELARLSLAVLRAYRSRSC